MSYNEAFSTYENLIYDETELSEDSAINAVQEFKMNFNEADINPIKVGEILDHYNNLFMTHHVKYSTDDGDYSVKKKKPDIILVHDVEKNIYLVVDGNHRLNTFYKEDPSWDILVTEIVAPLPEALLNYPFKKD